MDKASVARFLFLIITTINAVLNILGYETISDEMANNIVAIISGLIMIWAGWKNNYISKKGKRQKEILKQNGLAK